MENRKPTYEELYKMYEHEMELKNHLYYYLSFRGLFTNYSVYRNIWANEINKRIKQDALMFRLCVATDKLEFLMNVNKKIIVDIEYSIHPN